MPFLHKAADTVYRVLTFFHIKYIFRKCSLYISGFWSGELLRRAGGLQTLPGCAEPGPALWHLRAHGKQVLWPTGQQETPIKERARASGKGVISAELFTDHTTLCSYVPWGRGGCPQDTIAGVKYSPSEHLVRGSSWQVPQHPALGEQVEERAQDQTVSDTGNSNGLTSLQSQQTVVG